MLSKTPLLSGNRKTLMLGAVFAFSQALVSGGGAALTVTAGPVTEGNDPASPGRAEFVVRLPEAAATETKVRYTTASDTAREGTDYEATRGVLTIPAGQAEGRVSVPLVADTRHEDPESFSLIVWPDGQAPAPVLTEIPRPQPPAGGTFQWLHRAGGVSEGNWFHQNVLGQYSAAGWAAESFLTFPVDAFPGVLKGPWVVWPSGSQTSSFLNFTRRKSDGGGGGWETPESLLLNSASAGEQSYCAIAGDMAAVRAGWGITLVRLFRHQPAAIVGRVPLTSTHFVWPPEQVPRPKITGMAFTGQRLVVAVGEEWEQQLKSEIQIYEPVDSTGTAWRLKATIPDAAGPLVAEGDTVVARSLIGGAVDECRVYTQNQGGADHWGAGGVLQVPAPGLVSADSGMALNGGLLLVPDWWSNETGSGKIHTFLRSVGGNAWSYAGAFSSPQAGAADRFGTGMAWGGRDLLTLSLPNITNGDKGWGGSFPGATVTVTDDDAPAASLELPAVFEPSAGPLVARGALVLAQESAEPVTFKWQTSDGTARSGLDYVAASGEVTIPAGSLSAPLEVTILPDALTENTETLKVAVTQITGARLTESQALWTIRDTDRPAVVQADDIICAEGAPPVNAVVRLYPAADPLTVNVKAFAPTIPDHAGPVTDFGYAVPGVDWAGAPAVFSAAAATAGEGLLPLTGTQDTTEDGSRRGLLRFELPDGAVGASFSERLVQEPPPGSTDFFPSYGSMSTDGQWAAVIRYLPEGKSVLIYRKSTAPEGGWMFWSALPESVFDANLTGISLKLRGGRLLIYGENAGTVKVFSPGPEAAADRQWVQEAALDPAPGYISGSLLPTGFDGESMVFAPTNSRLVFINRGSAGDWTARQVIDFPVDRLESALVSMTEGRVAFARRRWPSGAGIRFLERAGSGPAPWRLDGESEIELPAGISDYRLWMCGNVLVTDRKIYRRQDDGTWQLEQTLPGNVQGIDRGLILEDSGIYADTGPPGARWQRAGQMPYGLEWPPKFEVNAGVVMGLSRYAPKTLQILEAGMGFTIADRETFRITPNPVEFPEPRYAESNAVVSIATEEAAPFDVPVNFETVPGGTATPGLDYRPVKGTVFIPAGARAASFAVPILPDAVPEENEIVQVNLTAPEFGRLMASSVTVTIKSFAIVPLTRTPVFVPEPASGQAVYQIPVNFSPASSTEVTAAYRITAGTAGAEDALLTQSGTVTVPAGMQTVLIPLTVYADALTEEPETLNVSLTGIGPFPGSPLWFTVTIDDKASGGSEPDQFTAPQNTGIDFDSGRNVLANDTSGNTLVSPSREPMNGTVTWREDGTFRYVPAVNFIGTDRFAYTSRRFTLPADTSWKWLNPQNGRDPGLTVPGFQADWMKPEFDASSWQNGKGLMAYGGIGLGTGAVTTDTDIKTPPSNRYTAYFRTSLSFPEDQVQGVAVEFICDDAAIFYLHGVEMGRYSKLPAGAFATAPDTYTLLAPYAFDDSEENQIRRLYFPSARFKAGENVIAVSVHNGSSSSSDLGLKVTGITPGNFSTPTWVTVDVTDSHLPAVLQDDVYAPPQTLFNPWNSPVMDSRLIRSSVYWNDGLLGSNGLPYDPILEVEIGGNPAGNVVFEKDTGHFRIGAAPNYYGTTGFTYRVRDKDGWSNTARVVITVPPGRSYDQWRALVFGADSFATAGLPGMDEDGDGTEDLLEFMFRGNPSLPDAPEPMRLIWNGRAWELNFTTVPNYGIDFSLKLESSASLADPAWTWLATFNDMAADGSLNRLAPGISFTDEFIMKDPVSPGHRYKVTLPPDAAPRRYFRLRAVREPNALYP